MYGTRRRGLRFEGLGFKVVKLESKSPTRLEIRGGRVLPLRQSEPIRPLQGRAHVFETRKPKF